MRDDVMQHASVNGVDLEYAVTGSGEPVLLISPVLADGFLPLLSERALAERYRLITYHKRGWAGSTHSPPPVTMDDHAADAAALLDHLGLRCAHIVGHSSGAVIALQLAFSHPTSVHSLTLLEPSFLFVPAAPTFLRRVTPAFDAYAAGDHEAALAVFMSTVSGLEWETCRAVLEQQVPGAVAQALEDADTLFGIELPALTHWVCGAEQVATVHQPMLSVIGTDTETLWVDAARVLRSWFPQVESCTIEGVGHLLHMQRPAPVAQGIAEFFTRHPLTETERRPAESDERRDVPCARAS